jgi:hypothetical protein
MKFICNDCQNTMEFMDNVPSENGGSLSIRYGCPNCGRSISMVTNTGETQVVRSLGVTIGHESLSTAHEPMAMLREALAGNPAGAISSPQLDPDWSESALKRLAAAPSFVQGMVRRLYNDYARQKGYTEITPAIMSEARDALGMTEM